MAQRHRTGTRLPREISQLKKGVLLLVLRLRINAINGYHHIEVVHARGTRRGVHDTVIGRRPADYHPLKAEAADMLDENGVRKLIEVVGIKNRFRRRSG